MLYKLSEIFQCNSHSRTANLAGLNIETWCPFLESPENFSGPKSYLLNFGTFSFFHVEIAHPHTKEKLHENNNYDDDAYEANIDRIKFVSCRSQSHLK